MECLYVEREARGDKVKVGAAHLDAWISVAPLRKVLICMLLSW